MRTILLGVVLLAAGLAGCLGAGETPLQASEAEPSEPAGAVNASIPVFEDGSPAPVRLTFRDCYEHFAVFPVPASSYRSRLPEGFTLDSFLGEPTGSSAELVVYGQACETPGGATVSRATTFLPVNPPDVWEHPDDDAGHDLVLSVTTTSERVAAVNEAWGFADVAAAGEVTLDRTETPMARTGSLAAEAGEASLSMETTIEGAPEELEGGKSRQFALGEGGTVTGAKDVNWTSFRYADGQASLSGSGEAGAPETTPLSAGYGGHAWAFEQRQKHVDLPPRSG